MALELVRLISQCAGVIAFLSLAGCFIAATAAIELSRAMVETADDAFRLARRMAVLGGGCVLLAALTSTLYWWGVGTASAVAAFGIAVALGLACVAFTLVARRLCQAL